MAGPKKLLNSKWTAVTPREREKHFLVVKVERDALDAQKVTSVTLEAVLTRRHFTLAWRELNDAARWRPGWS
ncbi:TIGR02450 family Trp-rich protein [Crenobacter luteus]|uniref:TIGR02450 family Trp-rich protein n=1 Tax=Crenobacter luteus TaxID=1452487 RepID=A0A165EXA7_9NEIS|nr:TIGR02450 family Trp-rich protein [Crenobacter luteus]KZE28871.1 hypothetical protein AVW16_13455 [Crenobacter luteus]